MSERARAELLAHPDRAIAIVDGRAYFVDGEYAGDPVHHVVTLLKPHEDDTFMHLTLVPRRTAARHRTAGAIIFWVVVWSIAFLFISAQYEPRNMFLLAVGVPLFGLLGLPAWISRRFTKSARTRIVPLRVTRESIEHDGVHRLDVLEVDGTQQMLLTTRKLATLLLVSSDYARSPQRAQATVGTLMPGIETVDDDAKRARSGAKDVTYAPVAVGGFPANTVYDESELEEQLARAAHAARSTRDQMLVRYHELEPWFADLEVDEEGTSTTPPGAQETPDDESVTVRPPRHTAPGGCLTFLLLGLVVPAVALGLAWLINDLFTWGITRV